MKTAGDLVIKQGETEITFTQILDAPRDIVFEAFSKAEHIRAWWLPAPCIMTQCTVDFRPGGVWRYAVQLPDGMHHNVRAIFRTIAPNETIEFDDYFVDDNDKIIDGLPSKHVTIRFDQAGEQTELIVHVQLQSVPERQKLVDMGFLQGFSTALGQLTKLIESKGAWHASCD